MKTILCVTDKKYHTTATVTPQISETGIPDFESSAIDHSANLPLRFAKVQHFFILSKNLF